MMEMSKYQMLREKVEVTGRCMNCRRKAVPGNIRCQVHVEINRTRSLAWRVAHPAVRAQEKKVFRDQGLCELCHEHRPAEAGKKHCSDCLERFRNYYHDRREFELCGVLACPNKSGEDCHCDACRERLQARARLRYFLKQGSTLKLPNGFTLGVS